MEDNHTEYFTCQCHHPEHTLRFYIDPELSSFECEIMLTNNHLKWYERAWIGIKYIFGAKKFSYSQFDNWIITQEADIDRMILLLQKVKWKNYD